MDLCLVLKKPQSAEEISTTKKMVMMVFMMKTLRFVAKKN